MRRHTLGSPKLRLRLEAAWQRTLEATAASILVILALPVFAACALAIAAESRGPIFYRCRRVGRGGGTFDMLKFRKMRADAAGPRLTAAQDERFTRVGRRLAAWKLDELPQLLNVVRGQMSLVGPRPEDPEFVAAVGSDFDEVLTVRPGITGLSQLAFARESEVLDREADREAGYLNRLLPQKLALDSLYARRRSLGLDLQILVWTAFAVFLRQDVAVNRATGALSVRKSRERVTDVVPERAAV